MITLDLSQINALTKLKSNIVSVRIFYLKSDNFIELVYDYLNKLLPKYLRLISHGYKNTLSLKNEFKFDVPELKPGEFLIVLTNAKNEAVTPPKKFMFISHRTSEKVFRYITYRLRERK